jgi:hypothetical protein
MVERSLESGWPFHYVRFWLSSNVRFSVHRKLTGGWKSSAGGFDGNDRADNHDDARARPI